MPLYFRLGVTDVCRPEDAARKVLVSERESANCSPTMPSLSTRIELPLSTFLAAGR